VIASVDILDVFQIVQVNPAPSVAAAVKLTVKLLAVQLMIEPKSPATTVYAPVLFEMVLVEPPELGTAPFSDTLPESAVILFVA
jgi:hypothetical protein